MATKLIRVLIQRRWTPPTITDPTNELLRIIVFIKKIPLFANVISVFMKMTKFVTIMLL